jgi:hypothetical protein
VQDDELAGHCASHRVADDVRLRNVQVVHQPRHVLDDGEAVLRRIVRLVALAVAAHVERDDAELLRQRVDDSRLSPIGVKRRGKAVDQHDRLAPSDVDVTDLDAARVEERIGILRLDGTRHGRQQDR